MKASMRKAAMIAALAIVSAGLVQADDISLTVYNSNLGVVRETRNLTFQQGSGRIAFTDVAAQIDPTSVSFELIDPKLAVAILEQNYAYDLVSPDKIYSKYIDQDIEIVTEKGEIFSGTLLSFTGGYLVIKQKDGRIFSVLQGVVRNVAFPMLPDGLITRPTLFWLYNSNFAGSADALVSYQTTGINWQAEYVGVLSDDEKTMELTGWVSIDNKSGKTYKDAKLKVIAGDISRVRQQPIYRTVMAEMSVMAMPKAAGFEEKPFFEYHLYTLPRPATIADNEIKQVTMFEPARAAVQKEYQYMAEPGQTDVTVFIKTTNTKEVGLGMPLPAGRVRIFKADSDGSMILLGEDRIDHTPRNEEVKLTVGRAFDVVGKTTTVTQRRITDQINETDFSIEVRNQKDKPVTVKISKNLGGYWEITKTSLDYVKKSASEVEWILDLPAEGKGTIDLTVRYTH
jgi:hypothetical protein